ncbi:SWIM-type domain-containing protein [Favolaschia claudopus]|uniref:SWIM-type domain-containing protein n=1 Tax=Favolaschia claudopus TaxID=2862362 RepID=A0AAW0DYL6_9AGAR
MSVLSCFANSTIASFDSPTDQSLLNLQAIFPRPLVLAALDLIDRGNVLKCIGPAQCHYDVLGSTATHRVYLDLPSPIPAYCTCPSFAYLVLSTDSYLSCKHILAASLAERSSHYVEQPIHSDQLIATTMQEYS